MTESECARTCFQLVLLKTFDIQADGYQADFPLKHEKHLREVGIKDDDDLIGLQQKQRQDMSVDFDTL